MNKAERLLELLTHLRAKRYAVTAKQLAECMGVSERTIYRDIQSLINSGVPIEGEAGVGYLLGKGAHLPPLMFTEKEMIALELGMRMVRAWSDKEIAQASQSASHKIMSVLPDRLKRQIEDFPLIVPDFYTDTVSAAHSQQLRSATDNKQCIRIHYHTEDGTPSQRVIQPLGQVFWGKVWTLVAWCELRQAYRNFRVDRIDDLAVLPQCFETSDTKSLKHYLSQYDEHY
ncbi:helix-turn-helix transcriptional regulator [Thaumasiovibrio subtropicus]|uniref:helix-turn-helix transcriptional regulator n=1 Tax=Thaumasiovibrio subtropicus TaxID=1891207 RepID=UPI000B35B24E|nr:YafY family protein [Thaumasiovibrio subtropicus]